VFPVHSRYEERWHDSVGWFVTNAVLESADPDPDTAACAAVVREAIRLGSWPLAQIMAPLGWNARTTVHVRGVLAGRPGRPDARAGLLTTLRRCRK
jgi:hypothetical protein